MTQQEAEQRSQVSHSDDSECHCSHGEAAAIPLCCHGTRAWDLRKDTWGRDEYCTPFVPPDTQNQNCFSIHIVLPKVLDYRLREGFSNALSSTVGICKTSTTAPALPPPMVQAHLRCKVLACHCSGHSSSFSAQAHQPRQFWVP